ncbi:MAG: hypothetical protein OXR73_18145 [Myxococcales bacterium]|nr:hypothetical protein [Myxococcales bacterium]
MRLQREALAVVVVLALGTAALLFLQHHLAIDACLDRGGRWMQDSGQCQDGDLSK